MDVVIKGAHIISRAQERSGKKSESKTTLIKRNPDLEEKGEVGYQESKEKKEARGKVH